MSPLILFGLVAHPSAVLTPILAPLSFVVGTISLFRRAGRTLWLLASWCSAGLVGLLAVSQTLLWLEGELLGLRLGSAAAFRIEHFYPALAWIALGLVLASRVLVPDIASTVRRKLLSVLVHGSGVALALASLPLVLERLHP